jgi:hypothetical protein
MMSLIKGLVMLILLLTASLMTMPKSNALTCCNTNKWDQDLGSCTKQLCDDGCNDSCSEQKGGKCEWYRDWKNHGHLTEGCHCYC